MSAAKRHRLADGRQKQARLRQRRLEILTMATTTITLDASLIGTIVGVPDGYITRFELVTSQWPAYQPDDWQTLPYPFGSFAGGGKLVLRDGDGKGQRLLAFNPSFENSPIMLNASCRYFGGLLLENCPRGAVYRLDISDVPTTTAAASLRAA
jgi:hypothetical protein